MVKLHTCFNYFNRSIINQDCTPESIINISRDVCNVRKALFFNAL